MANGSVVIVGGTRGLGRELARFYAGEGREVVVTGREAATAEAAAAEIGGATRGIGLDLCEPEAIAERLADVGDVEHLVLVAIDRDTNTVKDYDVAAAVRLVTLKLVGYTETIHTLLPRLREDASILLYGGLARDRPYPGSTTVTTINGAVTSMVRTLVVELAPRRVNALHPAIVGDSPYWVDMPEDRYRTLVSRTPIGRLVTMAEVVDASRFLLENGAINGINLAVDGGWLCL
ncbi:MAG TPA: SDR family oxidoreductase [Gaiellaceae bacterium]|nr:SDR family oxidoreductase [Gaiellaceae bacterium]